MAVGVYAKRVELLVHGQFLLMYPKLFLKYGAVAVADLASTVVVHVVLLSEVQAEIMHSNLYLLHLVIHMQYVPEVVGIVLEHTVVQQVWAVQAT